LLSNYNELQRIFKDNEDERGWTDIQVVQRRYSPDIHQCQQTKKQIQQQQSCKTSPLNLKSLAGAFGALVIGFILASAILIEFISVDEE